MKKAILTPFLVIVVMFGFFLIHKDISQATVEIALREEEKYDVLSICRVYLGEQLLMEKGGSPDPKSLVFSFVINQSGGTVSVFVNKDKYVYAATRDQQMKLRTYIASYSKEIQIFMCCTSMSIHVGWPDFTGFIDLK